MQVKNKMEQYKRYFPEQESDKEESKFDKKIDKILVILRDSDFGNENSRKEFISHITTLHNSRDPRARKAFKAMGNLFTEIGDELINMKNKEEE